MCAVHVHFCSFSPLSSTVCVPWLHLARSLCAGGCTGVDCLSTTLLPSVTLQGLLARSNSWDAVASTSAMLDELPSLPSSFSFNPSLLWVSLLRMVVLLLLLLLMWEREWWEGDEPQLLDPGDHNGVSSCLSFCLLEDFVAFYRDRRNILG